MMEAWATTSKSVCGGCIQTSTLMESLVGSQLSKEEERKSEKWIVGEGRERKRSQRERKKERENILYCLIKVILRLKIR